jgi:hypothetical protein
MNKENLYGPDLLSALSEDEISLALQFAEQSRVSCLEAYRQLAAYNFLQIAHFWTKVIDALTAKDTVYMSGDKQKLKWWAWHQAGMNRQAAQAAEKAGGTV